MKNRSKRVIATAVTILSVGLLPLPGLTRPSPYPPEPPQVENGEKPGEEPGGGNGCEPLNDQPEKDYDSV